MKYARAKRAKILFFIVKYANLWDFCCRRRRGCLGSLLRPTNGDTRNSEHAIETHERLLEISLLNVTVDGSKIVVLHTSCLATDKKY